MPQNLKRSCPPRDPLIPPASALVYDVLVINARDLMEPHTRITLLRRICTLVQRRDSGGIPRQGTWLFLLTHNHQEELIASTPTGAPASSSWCRGVRGCGTHA